MMLRRPDLRWWLIGLAVFAVVVALGAWLSGSSGFGIVDHQLAGDAATVDAIQADWRANGVRWLALLAMAGDLVFIGIYSFGAWVAGRGFARLGPPSLRAIGWIAAAAAALFCFTDYLETLLQFVQLLRERGSDGLAAIAAAMQIPKVLSFLVSFIAILAALILRRFRTPTA